MGDVLIGTAGWSYDDWEGTVYPPSAPKRMDRLVYLAGFLDTIEVNSTFYRLPSAKMCASWVRRTAQFENFLFSVKLFKELTHQRDRGSLNRLVSTFREGIDPIASAKKLSAVLVQFPWSFRWNEDNFQWLKTLTGALDGLPLAVEIRHRSWLNDDYLAFLRSREVAFCNIDQPQLHDCVEPTELATAPLAYVRLHGRNNAAWFAKNSSVNERYNYLYDQGQLADWGKRINTLRQRSDRVVVHTNNHFSGQAVANALQLKSILMNRRIAVPPHLISAFPQLKDIADAGAVSRESAPPPKPSQPTLFDDFDD